MLAQPQARKSKRELPSKFMTTCTLIRIVYCVVLHLVLFKYSKDFMFCMFLHKISNHVMDTEGSTQ